MDAKLCSKILKYIHLASWAELSYSSRALHNLVALRLYIYSPQARALGNIYIVPPSRLRGYVNVL